MTAKDTAMMRVNMMKNVLSWQSALEGVNQWKSSPENVKLAR
jgi:hypothetical protein